MRYLKTGIFTLWPFLQIRCPVFRNGFCQNRITARLSGKRFFVEKIVRQEVCMSGKFAYFSGMKEGVLEKLKILAESAKYDVSCSSSGTTRRNRSGTLGNAAGWGICHSFSEDGRRVSLL